MTPAQDAFFHLFILGALLATLLVFRSWMENTTNWLKLNSENINKLYDYVGRISKGQLQQMEREIAKLSKEEQAILGKVMKANLKAQTENTH